MKKLETMGQRIRALRHEKNLTQGDLAKIVGVSAPNVTGWEKDAYAPKADPLSKMASYFGVSTSYITHGDESGPQNLLSGLKSIIFNLHLDATCLYASCSSLLASLKYDKSLLIPYLS